MQLALLASSPPATSAHLLSQVKGQTHTHPSGSAAPPDRSPILITVLVKILLQARRPEGCSAEEEGRAEGSRKAPKISLTCTQPPQKSLCTAHHSMTAAAINVRLVGLSKVLPPAGWTPALLLWRSVVWMCVRRAVWRRFAMRSVRLLCAGRAEEGVVE